MKIAGYHSVLEALEENRAIEKVFVLQSAQTARIRELIAKLKKKNIPVSFVPKEKLHRLSPDKNISIAAFLSPINYVSPEQLVEEAFSASETPVFLLLDGITDTRNLGAIIRSAAAFGVAGIFLPANNSAPVTEETVRMSTGNIFKVPLSRVSHLKDAVFLLKASGVEIIAASEKTQENLETYTFSKPVALLVGNEHKGINPSLLKTADKMLKINMENNVDSLNVSVATAVFLYEIRKQLSSL